MKYYLYRHVRPDTGQPFYIGIGTKRPKGNYTSWRQEYIRAYIFHKENIVWKNIVNKNSGLYEIEILFESDSIELIQKKKEEFIELYGRLNLQTGVLVNLTNGGERNSGREGRKMTDRHKHILSERMKSNNPNKNGQSSRGKPNPRASQRMKEHNPRHYSNYIWTKKVFQYSLDGSFIKEWESMTEASNSFKTNSSNISRSLTKNTSAHGFLWRKEFLGKNIDPYILKTKSTPIVVYIDKQVLSFNSIKEAISSLPFSRFKIFKMLRAEESYMGYIITKQKVAK